MVEIDTVEVGMWLVGAAIVLFFIGVGMQIFDKNKDKCCKK